MPLPPPLPLQQGQPRPASRRQLLHATAGALLALQLRPVAAQATQPTLRTVELQWAAGKPVTEGRVVFDIAPLVENGNAVPVSVKVDSPMTAADHVQEIVIFNERNPFRDVVRFNLGPANGVAQVQTRIRLATSQQLVALARMRDGSQWSHHVEVLVTLAACIEP